jgi:hypothetical protein
VIITESPYFDVSKVKYLGIDHGSRSGCSGDVDPRLVVGGWLELEYNEKTTMHKPRDPTIISLNIPS